MISLSLVPIPLIGPATDSRIALSGYVELQQQGGPGPSKQTEDYELKLVKRQGKESIWNGTHNTVHALHSNPAIDRLTCLLALACLPYFARSLVVRTIFDAQRAGHTRVPAAH
jgi:hypothetical protein